MSRARVGIIGAVGLIAATIGVMSIGVSPAAAANITVTTNVDELNADGDCSLREAVQAANTNAAVDACSAGSGADVVTLGGEVYALTSQLVASDPAGLTILGAGPGATTIDGGDAVRIVDVTDGAITLDSITATNGAAGAEEGGVVRSSDGAVTVTNAVVSSSQGAYGGAIFTGAGAVTISDSTFTGNRGELNPLNGNGGAVSTSEGPITVRRSTFAGNSVANVGGAIVTGSGPIDVAESTFTDNEALAGAAMYASFTTILLVNTTLDGNTTDNTESLGGTVQTGGFGGSDITMRNVTLTDTITGYGVDAGADLTLANTIIAGNEGGDCQTSNDITSLGGNLDSDGTCNLSDESDLSEEDPLLAPLGDNGGATLTRFPEEASPAIDRGVNDECEAIDQRGVPRPQDGDDDGDAVCDRGAVEVSAEEEPAPPGPDSPNPPGSNTNANAAVVPRFTG